MPKTVLISGLTGMIAQTLTYPIDYVKTIKQLPKYKSSTVTNALKNEIKLNGPLAVYRGLVPQLSAAIPRYMIRFTVFEECKKRLSDEDGIMTTGKLLLSGMTSGIIEGATIYTASDMIKVQAINNNMNVFQAAKTIYNKAGFRGFYTGLIPTVLRQASTQGISFLMVNKSKPYYESNETLAPVSNLLAGMTGGAVAVVANNPIDAIKTYNQSEKMGKNIFQISKEIYRNNGILGFYKGCLLRALRVAPMYGITFYTYEYLKDLFAKYT